LGGMARGWGGHGMELLWVGGKGLGWVSGMEMGDGTGQWLVGDVELG